MNSRANGLIIKKIKLLNIFEKVSACIPIRPIRVKMCTKQCLKQSVGAPFPSFRSDIRGSSTLNNRASPMIIIARIPKFYKRD